MALAGLPMFTHGECVQKDNTSAEPPVHNPVGFATEHSEETAEVKKPTEKEQKEALMKDPTTLLAALLRGEVDIDDVRI